MTRKKKWLYIFSLFVVAITSIAFYLYKEYNRKNIDTAELEPDYTIAASAIIKEFETDQASASKSYSNKTILVKGFVKDILKDDHGFYSLMLGDTSSMSSVKCSMDSLHNNEAAAIKKGVYAAVKGVCAGFNADELLGSDVILLRCMIEKAKQ